MSNFNKVPLITFFRLVSERQQAISSVKSFSKFSPLISKSIQTNLMIGFIYVKLMICRVCAIILRGTNKLWQSKARELLAIVFALQQFRQYLWGKPFILRTEHMSLTYLFSQFRSNIIIGHREPHPAKGIIS